MEIYSTFENEDVISIDSASEKKKIPPVLEELDRGNKLYDERRFLKTRRKGQLKPLYDEARKKNNKCSKIAIYKLVCYTKKPKNVFEKEYPQCKHWGNIILERDILSQQEHIAILAQPKEVHIPEPQKYKMRCHFTKKYLPNTTTRVEDLSIPKKNKVKVTLKSFAEVLSARQIDNLSKILVPEENDFIDIQRTINLRREENKKKLVRKAKILRESAKVKRKIIKARKHQVHEVTYAIYEIMKSFLMTEHTIDMSEGMKNLSEILECKIKVFTGLFNSCELVDKFIKNLAKNLAIWMDKFISNFGFESLIHSISPEETDICPCEEKEFEKQIPIDDYMEMSEEFEMEEENEEELFDLEEWDYGEEGLFELSPGETAAEDLGETEEEEGGGPTEVEAEE